MVIDLIIGSSLLGIGTWLMVFGIQMFLERNNEYLEPSSMTVDTRTGEISCKESEYKSLCKICNVNT